MATQVRWVCGQCGKGKLGPQKPRRNNIVRYCLPCSQKAGVLVETAAPALEKKREARARVMEERRKARERKERERQHKRDHITLTDAAGRTVEVHPEQAIREIAKRAGIRRNFDFTWNRRTDGFTTGTAWSHRIHLSIGNRRLENFASVCAHELAHLNNRKGSGHDDHWRDEYERIVREVWGVNGTYRGFVAHHRYAIDPEIEEKLRAASRAETPRTRQFAKRPLVGRLTA